MTSMGLFNLTANFWCGPRPLPHSLRAGPGRGLRLLVGTLGLGEYPRGVPFTALGLLGAVAPQLCLLMTKVGLLQDTMALAADIPLAGCGVEASLSCLLSRS